MLALGADCVLLALARTNGDRPALAVVHAGWRGLIDDDDEVTGRSLGSRLSAVVGPAIGPCCYEVGEEVASGSGTGTGGASSTTASSTSGRPRSKRRGPPARPTWSGSTSARSAGPTFSSPSGGRGGRVGLKVSSGLSPEAVRARYERVRERSGRVTVVAATKYVSAEDMGVLLEAGIEVVGENRAQDLEAKHAAHGDAFRWHFIGHLQSRKAKVVNGIWELVHSLDSESAAEPPGDSRTRPGEPRRRGTKSGIDPQELPPFLELYPTSAACRRCLLRRKTPKNRARTSANCVKWPNNTG